MSIGINFHSCFPEGLKLLSFYPENNMSLTLVCPRGGELTIFGARPAQAWAIFDVLATPDTDIIAMHGDRFTVAQDAERAVSAIGILRAYTLPADQAEAA